MLAVLKTGGKQYLVKEKTIFSVENIPDVSVGDILDLKEILMIKNSEGGEISYNSGLVRAEVLEKKRDKKVIVFKKKRRSNYRRKNGHRRELTILKVSSISV